MKTNQTKSLNELHLFAGCGGGILGGILCGHTCVCAVEIEPYPRKVLLQRQRDGMLPRFPIWDDVTTFDGRPWRGRVDVVCGGFPCQDISVAGKGAGLSGDRSGLWGEMVRIISEVMPRYILVENSPALTTRGGQRVAYDLASMGFVGSSGVLGAEDAIWYYGDPAADHERRRMWFYGKNSNPNGLRELQPQRCEQNKRGWVCNALQAIPDTDSTHGERVRGTERIHAQQSNDGSNSWWHAEPGVRRVADGVANRVDRLKAIGNGQVPAVAALAWNILSKRP